MKISNIIIECNLNKVVRGINRKIVAFIVAFCLVIYPSKVLGDKLGNSLKEKKEGLKASQDNYDKISRNLEKLENEMEKLDNDIEKKMTEISKGKKEIKAVKSDINHDENLIEKENEDILKKENILSDRAKLTYMGEDNDYLNIILSSRNIDEFMTNIAAIENVVEDDKDAIKQFTAEKSKIQEDKSKLENKNKSLNALQDKNTELLKALQANKSKQSTLRGQYNIQLAKNKKEINRYKNEIAGILAQIKRNAGNFNSAAVYSDNAVVAYATSFLGINYLWGGNVPSTGFDCSGLTRYVYAHFGIDLPRVAEDQQKVGVYESIDNLKPGDLVFFGNPAYHVGIYAGSGYFIHAPHTGDCVKISPLSERDDFSGGKRIVQ